MRKVDSYAHLCPLHTSLVEHLSKRPRLHKTPWPEQSELRSPVDGQRDPPRIVDAVRTRNAYLSGFVTNHFSSRASPHLSLRLRQGELCSHEVFPLLPSERAELRNRPTVAGDLPAHATPHARPAHL